MQTGRRTAQCYAERRNVLQKRLCYFDQGEHNQVDAVLPFSKGRWTLKIQYSWWAFRRKSFQKLLGFWFFRVRGYKYNGSAYGVLNNRQTIITKQKNKRKYHCKLTNIKIWNLTKKISRHLRNIRICTILIKKIQRFQTFCRKGWFENLNFKKIVNVLIVCCVQH